jgi:hypothetical protein
MVAVAARKPLTMRKISTRAKLACGTLMDEAADIQLTKDTKQELEMIMHCTDDGTQVDPLIVLTSSVPTGVCRIYMKEVVPLSLFLLALASKAVYQVQVTEKAKSKPTFFDSVVCRPFKGDANKKIEAQPFDLANILQVDDNILEQVTAYMFVIGPVSSQDACDRDFIETHLEKVKEIFNGELVLVEQKSQARKMVAQEEEE